MGLNLDYSQGQTPLEEDEKEGLRMPFITTRDELDEFEQKNIEEAIKWTIGRKLTVKTVLTETFVKDLHQRMFGEVWLWAGSFRNTQKNLGVDYWKISTELKVLLDDTTYWINNRTFSDDEISIRFKHKLVSIHCFPNGNGRHSRLMADIICEKIFKKSVFTWGKSNISAARDQYLKSLKLADNAHYEELIRFARS